MPWRSQPAQPHRGAHDTCEAGGHSDCGPLARAGSRDCGAGGRTVIVSLGAFMYVGMASSSVDVRHRLPMLRGLSVIPSPPQASTSYSLSGRQFAKTLATAVLAAHVELSTQAAVRVPERVAGAHQGLQCAGDGVLDGE